MIGNKTRLTTLITVLLITAMVAGAGVATVTADHETDGDRNLEDSALVDDLFGSQDANSDICSSVTGVSCDGLTAAVQGFFDGMMDGGAEEADATTYAENTKDTFNEDAGAIQNWTNDLTTAQEDWEVIRITFTDDDGNVEHLFIVSEVNHETEEFEEAQAMNISEFQDAGHDSYDQWYRLDEDVSRNANAELETFVDEFVTEDETPDDEWMAYMGGKYAGGIDGSVMPGDH